MSDSGPDAQFWADPSCLQCRADILLQNHDEYREMIREATRHGWAMEKARQMLTPEQADGLHEEAVLVGYRKGRAELCAIMLDSHECGLV